MFALNPTHSLNEPSTLSVLLCADQHAVLRLGPMIRRLAIGLLDQAVEVRLLAYGHDLQEMATGSLEVIQHHSSPWPFARMQMRRLLDTIAERSPTVIHALSPTIGLLTHAIAEEVEAEWVVHLSSADECRLAANSGLMADAWITGSNFLRDLAVNPCRLPQGSVEVIRPGVPVGTSLACFADDEQEPTILCTAPFIRESGVDRLLTAMKLLKNRGTNPLLFLWGEGPLEGAHRAYVKQHELSAQVTFARPIGEAVDAMDGADILVHTETQRAICMDVLQAMGRGLAVVSPIDVGCDSTSPGKTAFAWDPTTAETLADVLQRVIQDRDGARDMAQRGVDHIRAQHSVSGMAEQVARLYHRLVSQHATIRLKE